MRIQFHRIPLVHRIRLVHQILLAMTVFAITGCQDLPPADQTGATTASTRDQLWNLCKDPNRGLVAANACAQLIQSGQESRQTLAYVHYNRGMALGRRGRAQDAIADYDAALAQDPFFALALYQRGLLYQQLGQRVRADQDLRRAQQLDPRLR